MYRALRGRTREGSLDLEALETQTKDVMLHCGAMVLKQLLTHEDASSLNCAVWVCAEKRRTQLIERPYTLRGMSTACSTRISVSLDYLSDLVLLRQAAKALSEVA